MPGSPQVFRRQALDCQLRLHCQVRMRYFFVMIVKTTQEEATLRRFEKKLRPYITRLQPKAIPLRRQKNRKSITLGELVSIPASDITHVFNNEAMLAISHAIEDLAGETRQGELLATFQKIENFTCQKQRYVSLSQDLDAVRVWAAGRPPARAGKIDFVPIFRPELEKYWIVLFASPRAHAVLVCRQSNQATRFTEKIFTGFYSFNPFLTESIRRHFNLISCGLDGMVTRWEKELHLPAVTLGDINSLLLPPSVRSEAA